MNFGTDMYGAQRMNPTHVGDPLTFFSSATMWLTFVVLSEMC